MISTKFSIKIMVLTTDHLTMGMSLFIRITEKNPHCTLFLLSEIQTILLIRTKWGSEIQLFKIWKHLKSIFFSGSYFKGLWFQPFENQTIKNLDIFVHISNDSWQKYGHLSGFKMVGLPAGFWIPLQNPNHLQTNLILTIQNPDYPGFPIPLHWP